MNSTSLTQSPLMKPSRYLPLLVLSLFSFSACKSPVKKAAVRQTTGVGKGPMEKAENQAEKRVGNAKKDVKKETSDLKRGN